MELRFLLLFLLALSINQSHCGLLDKSKPDGSVLRLKSDDVRLDPSRVTQLSRNPRAFLYRKFLTEEECDHLIQLAKDKLEKSMVADNESGKSIESTVRTSSGMFLSKGQDDVVSRIEARIARWTFLPLVNQQLGGHRVATVLMYLSDVKMGGETIFPDAELKQEKDDSFSDCAKKGYAVQPRKGDALLFFSLHPDATTDTSSLHGSCPVIEGEKWSATKWIHVKSFDKPVRHVEQGECADENPNCAQWAAAGECKKNPLYMVGSNARKGYCRKSCEVC